MYKINIPVSKLTSGMVLAEPVHIANQVGETVVVLPYNYKFTEKTILALNRMKNYRTEYVSIYSETNGINSHSDPSGPLILEQDVDIKPQSLLSNETKDKAINIIRDLYSTANPNENSGVTYQILTHIDKIMNELVDVVTKNPKGLVHISGLRSYDEYTYHHSLSVSILAVAIGQSVGLSQMEIKRLGRSAMMHDIGKIMIPHNLITKPTVLTIAEYAEVQKHPAIGAKFLKSEFVGNTELWDAVMYHHEKYNGKGYPKGLAGKQIPLHSRIISVADVYDALTSYRSYRDPMRPPYSAVEMIMSESEASFDFEIVDAFVRRIVIYPINTILQISDNRIGTVVNNHNSMRPVVKIQGSDELVDLAALDNLHLTVTWAEAY